MNQWVSGNETRIWWMFLFQFGILRFCGPTDFASGVWAGVELETPIGKNDGSVGGVSYFECFPKHGKLTMRSNSQSFKMQKPASSIVSRPLIRSLVSFTETLVVYQWRSEILSAEIKGWIGHRNWGLQVALLTFRQTSVKEWSVGVVCGVFYSVMELCYTLIWELWCRPVKRLWQESVADR